MNQTRIQGQGGGGPSGPKFKEKWGLLPLSAISEETQWDTMDNILNITDTDIYKYLLLEQSKFWSLKSNNS